MRTLRYRKNKGLYIITFFCVICLLPSSCTGKICPGFPDHLVDYLPYRTKNIFSFENQDNDTITFWVREVVKYTEYRTNPGTKTGNTCKSFLTLKFIAHRLISESLAEELGYGPLSDKVGKLVVSSIILTGEIVIYTDNREPPKINIQLDDHYLDFTTINPFGPSEFYFYAEKDKDPFDSQNRALFGDSVILENPEIQNSRVVIVKGEGITDFYDQKHDFHWKKIKK